MSEEGFVKKYVLSNKGIEDMLYGADEDIFVRHARKKEFNQKYGNIHLVAWVPGLYAYVNIKETIKNPEFTTKQKIGACAFFIFGELVLDAARAGSVYALYKIPDF